jgi:hypothetical protein
MLFEFRVTPRIGFEIEAKLNSLFVEVFGRSVFLSLERPRWAVHGRASRVPTTGQFTGEVFVCGLSVSF